MEKKRIFITGMSGYLGTCLCRQLEHLDWCGRFYGMDVRRPLYKFDKGEFKRMDICDPALADWLGEIKPDILVHLAYVLQEIHDQKLMRRINYDGSVNAINAAEKAGVRQILVASSGTAYGAWPDNPVPLKEDHELKPNPGFLYAVDKERVERICRDFAARHSDRIMSMIRPCVVYGPNVNNYLSELLNRRILVGPRGFDPPLQFVHEDDLARAIIRILEKEAKGVFNIAPPDTIRMKEIFDMVKRLNLGMPDWLMKVNVGLLWFFRIPLFNISAGFLDYIRYPWVIDSGRLLNELGFKFRYSTRETVEIMLRAKGILP